jgi:hypothetical protein
MFLKSQSNILIVESIACVSVVDSSFKLNFAAALLLVLSYYDSEVADQPEIYRFCPRHHPGCYVLVVFKGDSTLIILPVSTGARAQYAVRCQGHESLSI